MRHVIAVATILFSLLIVLFPAEAAGGAGKALMLCANTLIPSLFPFMVCINLLISCGAAGTLSRRLERFMRPVFGVSGAGALPLVMGLIGGYPCGALTVSSLYDGKSITKKDAMRLLAFTNNSGPLFIIGAVGMGLYNNSKAGNILYAAHVLSALSCGLIAGLFGRGKKEAKKSVAENTPSSDAVYYAVVSVLTLCGYVVIFSVGIELLKKLGVISAICGFMEFFGLAKQSAGLVVLGFLEMTNGIFDSQPYNLPLVSAIISFGGLSVLMQVKSILQKSGLPIWPYLAGKLTCAVLTYLYTTVLLKFYPVEISVFSDIVKRKIIGFSCYTAAVLWAFVLFAAATEYLRKRRTGPAPRPRRRPR